MKSINVNKCVLFVLSIMMFSQLMAEDGKELEHGLFLSPENCFLLNDSQKCDLNIKVRWHLDKKSNVCLYKNQEIVHIQCWKDQSNASIVLFLSVEKDVLFELRSVSGGKTLFTAPLKIYKEVSKLRRKRRNPWSFY